MTFFLGTHEVSWLWRTSVPLFVSRRRLVRRKTPLRKAIAPWALDSGAFTELTMYGKWRLDPEQYADEVQRWSEEAGPPLFVAPMDWCCEPFMLDKTGKTVLEHQERTVQSYLDLTALAPGVPWCPVLQGWEITDYVDHAAMYERAGIDLGSMPRVGVGSVCRRQGTWQAVELFADLRHLKLRLHGFGLKIGFLKQVFRCGLESFDSLAWSLRARKRGVPLDGCKHASCANCMKFALMWRDQVMSVGKLHGQPEVV
jgi:hypothetical protein